MNLRELRILLVIDRRSDDCINFIKRSPALVAVSAREGDRPILGSTDRRNFARCTLGNAPNA
jgi:hypothetical protein